MILVIVVFVFVVVVVTVVGRSCHRWWTGRRDSIVQPHAMVLVVRCAIIQPNSSRGNPAVIGLVLIIIFIVLLKKAFTETIDPLTGGMVQRTQPRTTRGKMNPSRGTKTRTKKIHHLVTH